ncbi:hypothetical protein A6R68_06326 [Neotoma lepida]|uniref:Uncharacterized protein n=1 Tax=Neotoma lepida TaxID=56216 RepID=A0A1A6GH02_NEOLE|nr:hypothetical protein A6R68_06326 [Neotoma lepida]
MVGRPGIQSQLTAHSVLYQLLLKEREQGPHKATPLPICYCAHHGRMLSTMESFSDLLKACHSQHPRAETQT